jgi:hypothetical protein
MMNPRILNRDGKLPDDGWYNIEANGEHVNHASKVVLVIDEKTRTSIVNRFAAEVKAAGENFPGIAIDKDHLSKQVDEDNKLPNPSEAYGWGMQVRNRDGLLEAKVDWTGIGLPLVDSKDGRPPAYKFFSTEYDPGECEKIGTRKIANRTYDVVRPLRLDGLSLTNDPNNKGQRPISNRNGNPAGATDENQTMKSLLKELKLSEDASEESAVAALRLIINRASQVEALTTERDALLVAQVESDLEKYKNRFKAENREKVKKQLIANRAGTIELLEATEPVEQKDAKGQITNRKGATPPAGGATEGGEGDDQVRADKITNRAHELQGQNAKRSFDECWNQAQREIYAAKK